MHTIFMLHQQDLLLHWHGVFMLREQDLATLTRSSLAHFTIFMLLQLSTRSSLPLACTLSSCYVNKIFSWTCTLSSCDKQAIEEASEDVRAESEVDRQGVPKLRSITKKKLMLDPVLALKRPFSLTGARDCDFQWSKYRLCSSRTDVCGWLPESKVPCVISNGCFWSFSGIAGNCSQRPNVALRRVLSPSLGPGSVMALLH